MDVVADDAAALGETQRAFDGVAAAYHRSNVSNPLLEAMRRRLWSAVHRHVPRGAHLLDLGCGPGTDAAPFAARGYRVTAIDWSPAMVDEAQRRVRAHGVDDRVDVIRLGIHELDQLAPATFDAVCSNLGPLNCVPDLAAAAALVRDRVRPGGVLVASAIGRVCPWEIALYAARGDWRRLRVRFAPQLTAVPLDGRTVWTRYYTPSAFARVFAAAGFATIERRALGLFVPPPYLEGFALRHPAAIRALQAMEDAVGAWPGLREMGDHFLIAMRRVTA
ncbi:MAG TPA: methyltransferase domain-containing protein [Vicinamibacterales bacterium]|nr:methyltransferase domain-containing protein [Vicinamibacterales bacterium]